MNRYQQWEWLKLKGREMQLDIDDNILASTFRIGAKRYHNVVDASVALIRAFEQVGVKIPPEVRNRPIDMG